MDEKRDRVYWKWGLTALGVICISVVLVVIFTACTIALLSRRDREEAERAENEEPHRHPTGSYHVR